MHSNNAPKLLPANATPAAPVSLQLAFQAATAAPSPAEYAARKTAEREQAAAHFRALHLVTASTLVPASTDATPSPDGQAVQPSGSGLSIVRDEPAAEPEPLPAAPWYAGAKYEAWVHETALDLFADARSVTADDGHALELADQAAITSTQDERELQDVREELARIADRAEGDPEP